MTDIFFSYTRERRARAKLFAEAASAHSFSICRDVDLKAHKAVPGERLELRVGLARVSQMSETIFRSFSLHFIHVWNATPLEPGV